ncbi:MAG: hypothetical protein HYX74_01670 [Acidobacteria bacterium]|nr:hypothetical protein [Acidobacteriota bacterium]
MDKPRHPVVVRTWKVERVKERAKNLRSRAPERTARRGRPGKGEIPRKGTEPARSH